MLKKLKNLIQKIKSLKSQPPKPGFKRAKCPTLIQMEAVECGAAALGIILGHYGRFVPLEELRVACGVSRDGSKASNVLKAARNYNMVAKGFKKSIPKLHEMRMPVVVFWNFNHFLVVEGFGKDKVYLNDPAAGPRTVTHDEFDQSYTGVVLAIEPGADFEKGGERKSLVKALKKRIKGSEAAIAYVVLAGLALVIPGMVIPVFSRIFVDNILVQMMQDWFKPLILGMIITMIFRGVLTWLQQYYLLRFETKLALSMSSQFFNHVLRMPVEFFTQRHAGDLSSRVAINDKVAMLLSGELANNLLNLIVVVFYAILMFHYSIILTVIGIAIAGLNALALRLVARKRKDTNQRLLQDRGKLMGTSMSGLMTIETIKSGGTESDFFAKWAGYQAKVMNGEQQLAITTQILNLVPPLLTGLNTALILGVGSFQVMSGKMTIGMLVAFQSLMASFIEPINKMVTLGTKLQEAEGDLNRLDDVFHYQQDPIFMMDGEKDEKVVRLNGYLDLKNITFGYSPLEPPLIENFNLSLKPGSRVALVGGSGSGKSTVAKLVCGLYQPWSGEIIFDGKVREQVSRNILTNSLALVDQDIFLFEGTIYDNLTMWNSTTPKTDVIRGAKDAAIHDEIAARTGGYYSVVEENGRNFSGGQRQRLEIARALVNFPSILIMDEATSALDPTTEKIIDDNIRRRGCTCLIVAHRLSTIRDCDEIIVLERGKVVQRGTHDEMKNVDGAYARLIKSI